MYDDCEYNSKEHLEKLKELSTNQNQNVINEADNSKNENKINEIKKEIKEAAKKLKGRKIECYSKYKNDKDKLKTCLKEVGKGWDVVKQKQKLLAKLRNE